MLALYWHCTDTVLALCWHCTGTVLTLYCHPAATVLLQYRQFTRTPVLLHWHCDCAVWQRTGTTLVLHWHCTGTSLGLDWYYTGTSLVLYWYFTGTLLVLHWCFTGTSLVPQLYFTCTSLELHWSPSPFLAAVADGQQAHLHSSSGTMASVVGLLADCHSSLLRELSDEAHRDFEDLHQATSFLPTIARFRKKTLRLGAAFHVCRYHARFDSLHAEAEQWLAERRNASLRVSSLHASTTEFYDTSDHIDNSLQADLTIDTREPAHKRDPSCNVEHGWLQRPPMVQGDTH